MEQLIKQITQKFGLPDDTAKGIVQMVANFLKEKLPEPIGSQASNFLSKGEIPQQAKGFFGRLFGGTSK